MFTSSVEPRPKRLRNDVLHREEVIREALATGPHFVSLFFEERGHVVANLFAKGSREEEQEVSVETCHGLVSSNAFTETMFIPGDTPL